MPEDFEVARVERIAREGLTRAREGLQERVEQGLIKEGTPVFDTFAIVGSFAYKTPSGDDLEETYIWSESKRRYVQSGLLSEGQAVLSSDEAEAL